MLSHSLRKTLSFNRQFPRHGANISRLRYTFHGCCPAMIQYPRARIASACFCLLAVLFLYAPLGAAVWSAHDMACCTGDHCPISGHHHQKPPAPAHYNCGHEMAGMTACSMSCCQTTDSPAVTSLAFVLPQLNFSSTPALITTLENAPSSIVPMTSSEPLSPPPRFALAAC